MASQSCYVKHQRDGMGGKACFFHLTWAKSLILVYELSNIFGQRGRAVRIVLRLVYELHVRDIRVFGQPNTKPSVALEGFGRKLVPLLLGILGLLGRLPHGLTLGAVVVERGELPFARFILLVIA